MRQNPPHPARRRLFGAVVLLASFPVAWLAAPLIRAERVPVCIFYEATGWRCPFCGLTRAFACATHGQLAEAWRQNPLWPLAAGLIIAFAVCLIVDARRPTRWTARLEARLYRHWRLIVAGLIVFGVVRICV